ncbi:hypothetical protein [Pseudomonas fluorescens]|uniref:hypothetical protein n=1 Tax=Pseudomonas fluorescens TaxID=294 RepID=UPI003D0197EB
MFGYGHDDRNENLRGTMSIFGRPVSVIRSSEIGTQRSHVEPTLFYFYGGEGKYSISAGDIADKKYVALDKEGYLCIGGRAEPFTLLDSNDRPLQNNRPQGEVVIKMYASYSAAVLQFGGDEAFDDRDTLYNFLIAGRKVEGIDRHGDAYYLVPTGDGSWKKHPADKPFVHKPVPIVLNIK